MHDLADAFLGYLDLERQPPSREFLDAIVREHQLRVPFETLSKLIDWERGHESGEFLPPVPEYVARIIDRGAGGTCWTLARGLHWLLSDLGFDAAFMYMDPGHVCLRVELGQPHYVDAGYAAPLFRAYPLFEPFALDTSRERFDYAVQGGNILVTRTPGPVKLLDPRPRRLEELREHLVTANQWNPGSFLTRLAYARHVNGTWVSLNNGTLRRHLSGGVQVVSVDGAQIDALFRDEFGADPALYAEAEGIRGRWMSRMIERPGASG